MWGLKMKIFSVDIRWVGESDTHQVLITDYTLSEQEQAWVDAGEDIPIADDGEYRDSDIFFYGMSGDELNKLMESGSAVHDFYVKGFGLAYEEN